MGSYSTSINQATDNRLAVTDQGFGLSSSGSRNQTTLDGAIVTSSGSGNTINLLDGGAINKAFDFAQNSLSNVLNSVINGQKSGQGGGGGDTIGDAVKQTALNNEAADKAAGAGNTFVLQVIAGLVVTGIGFYLFKGRK